MLDAQNHLAKSLFAVLTLASLAACDKPSSRIVDEATVLLDEKLNQRYDMTAQFFGIRMALGNNEAPPVSVIQKVVFKGAGTGAAQPYVVTDDTAQAADFYFTNIWSADEEYAALPVGKTKGFALYAAKTLMQDIKTRKYADVIRVKGANSGWYWHDFGAWEAGNIIRFRAGLDGDMFAYKYDLSKKTLTCFREKCAELDVAENINGPVKMIEAAKPWPADMGTTQVR
jgi:hypothetical protein